MLLGPLLADHRGHLVHGDDPVVAVVHPPGTGLDADGEFARDVERLERVEDRFAAGHARLGIRLRIAVRDRQRAFELGGGDAGKCGGGQQQSRHCEGEYARGVHDAIMPVAGEGRL